MKQERATPPAESLDRRALEAHQAERLRICWLLLAVTIRSTPEKLRAAGIALESLHLLEDLGKLPFTVKNELVADQAARPPFGTKYTEPLGKLHAVLPDILDYRISPALARYE